MKIRPELRAEAPPPLEPTKDITDSDRGIGEDDGGRLLLRLRHGLEGDVLRRPR